MKPTNLDPLSSEIESLLASERVLVEQPEDVRRRAFMRARGAMVSSAMVPKGRPWFGGFRLMLAAAAVLVAASLSAAAIRARRHVDLPAFEPAPAAPKVDQAPAVRAVPEGLAPEPTDPSEVVSPNVASPASPRATTGPEGYALELKVLQPARAAVARGDFSSALSAIAEHERRFPVGQLTEEREALRVQALSGAHRTDEARRAAVAFRKRFPHSVLLSRMKEALQATP
jgi:hypothetical protein